MTWTMCGAPCLPSSLVGRQQAKGLKAGTCWATNGVVEETVRVTLIVESRFPYGRHYSLTQQQSVYNNRMVLRA